MGSCTRRHFLLSTCFLQMITVVERQVFDFLGYMWAPIIVNFFHIIFIIFGFFGAYHLRAKYIIAYLIWNFIWIGWNVFLICFYLDVGVLDKMFSKWSIYSADWSRCLSVHYVTYTDPPTLFVDEDSDILNLGTGSVSWFEVNGYGCVPTYPTNITTEDLTRPVRPEQVDNCFVDYPIVEVIHSGIQCILAVLAILGAILIALIFFDEDDRFDFMGGDAKSPQHTCVHPMYVSYSSIPTSASTTMLSNKHIHNNNHSKLSAEQSNQINSTTNPKQTPPSSLQSSFREQHHRHYQHHPNHQQQEQQQQQQQQAQPKTARIQSSRKNSSNYSSFITRPDLKYTQISTEQLMSNLDDSHESFSLNTFQTAADQSGNTYIPFQKPVPAVIMPVPHDSTIVNPLHDNSDLILTKNINNNAALKNSIGHGYSNNNFYNEISSADELSNDPMLRGRINPIFQSQSSSSSSRPYEHHHDQQQRPIQLQQIRSHVPLHFQNAAAIHSQQPPSKRNQPSYPDVSPESTENYVMPYQYVTRSPNLNRISVRRRNDRNPGVAGNFCDQIRNAPPGYDEMYMARAKSQDRLSNRSRNRQTNSNHRGSQRPRSYCDNANIITDKL